MHVIIVGGGIAGLAMAHRFVGHDPKIKITIIERDKRLGGRIYTINDGKGQFEAGAGRLSNHHPLALGLVKQLGLDLQPIKSQYAFVSEGTVIHSRTMYNALMRKVLEVTSKWSADRLRSMTFGEVCKEVLGVKEAKLVKDIFGYNAEFELTNGYDGREMFNRDFKGSSVYYHVNGGMSRIIEELWHKLHKHVTLLKRHTVTHVAHTRRYGKNECMVQIVSQTGRTFELTADCVVCAVPQATLMDLFPEEEGKLKSINPVALNRAYAYVTNKEWLSHCPITTTTTRIRQFIPINTDLGLVMASYSDTKDARFWFNHADESILKRELHKVFGVSFGDLQNVKHYYWEAGVHVWKPNVDSGKLSRDVMFLKGEDVPIYVVGEAYSKHQAWIEGALETVNTAWPSIISRLYAKNGGRIDQQLNLKEYIFLNDQTLGLSKTPRIRIVDVSTWKFQHPGGSEVYKRLIGKDATLAFMNVSRHFINNKGEGSKPKLSPWVKSVLKKYTVGIKQYKTNLK